ncbi:hypothetical protein F5Y02DRAFT_426436 [Annulohypoxylon stygium]|nr:hypothetical protein F5Y02DRAFT_426436 [Annulohypoxylon stygium]
MVIPAVIVLTLILTFWLRFEYQACRYLPWMVLACQSKRSKPLDIKRNDAVRTIALDYASMWTPNAIVVAAKNKHFLVLCALVTSMFLRIQIILSALLFYVHLVNNTQNVKVDLQDQFLDRVDVPFSPIMDSRPYRLESGNWTTQLEYPQYVAPGVALQHFDDKVLVEIENNTALTITVDGVTVSTSCETPPVSITSVENGTTNFTVSPRLHIPSRVFPFENMYPAQLLKDPYLLYYWEDTSYNNHSVDPFFMAMVISGRHNGSKVDFQTTALSCTLGVQVYPFEVIMENAKLSAVKQSEAEATRSIHGGLLDYMWRSYPNPIAIYPQDRWIGGGTCGGIVTGDIIDFNVDSFSGTDLIPFKVGGRLLKSGPLNGSEFANQSILEETMKLYHSVYGSLVANYDFRRPDKSSTNGTISRNLSRLGVQPYISQAMVGIFGLTMVLTLPLFWEVSPKDGFVPFEPHTLAGMAILLSRSHGLLRALSNCGHQPIKVLLEQVKGAYYTSLIHNSSTPLYPSFQLQRLKVGDQSRTEAPPTEPKKIDWYRPWTLHPASRIISLLTTIGFLATLVALMQRSLCLDGIGDALSGSSFHYLWTSLPSLFFISLSTYFGGCDFELRSLAPFVLLSSRPATYSEGLTLSFTDQSIARAFFRSLKRGHLVILFSTLIVFLSSLLSIFAANLFTVQVNNISKPISLQQVQWFTSMKFELQQSKLADLVLNANLSYPPWTFEDLVIPQYQLANPMTPNELQLDSIITGQLRAARANLDCDYSTSIGNVSIDIYGDKTTCKPSGLIVCPMDANEPFGLDPIQVRWLCDDKASIVEGWPALMYSWGKCQNDQQALWGNDSYATVMICNETFEEVEVQITLFGPNLEIRESHPPIPINSSRNPITLNFNESIFEPGVPGYDIPDPYNNLIGSQGQNRLFDTLTSSRYAIPDGWLGDTSRREDVIAAIKKLHGIVRAQMLRGSTGAWLYFNDTSANQSLLTRDKSPIPPVDGEMWQTVPRVVQNEAATYILVGFLAAIFILDVLLVWLSEVHGYRRAVPKPPGTIVAVASLFVNSTFLGHLPSNAQWTTHQKLEKHFEGKRFQMGWFSGDTDNEGSVFTIGVVNDT